MEAAAPPFSVPFSTLPQLEQIQAGDSPGSKWTPRPNASFQLLVLDRYQFTRRELLDGNLEHLHSTCG